MVGFAPRNVCDDLGWIVEEFCRVVGRITPIHSNLASGRLEDTYGGSKIDDRTNAGQRRRLGRRQPDEGLLARRQLGVGQRLTGWQLT